MDESTIRLGELVAPAGTSDACTGHDLGAAERTSSQPIVHLVWRGSAPGLEACHSCGGDLASHPDDDRCLDGADPDGAVGLSEEHHLAMVEVIEELLSASVAGAGGSAADVLRAVAHLVADYTLPVVGTAPIVPELLGVYQGHADAERAVAWEVDTGSDELRVWVSSMALRAGSYR